MQVLAVEYSLAAGVRSKADRLRLRLAGWSNKDLADMLLQSRGDSEDADVRAERLRVDTAAGRRRGAAAAAAMADTVLIQGLTKVTLCFMYLPEYMRWRAQQLT